MVELAAGIIVLLFVLAFWPFLLLLGGGLLALAAVAAVAALIWYIGTYHPWFLAPLLLGGLYFLNKMARQMEATEKAEADKKTPIQDKEGPEEYKARLIESLKREEAIQAMFRARNNR